MITLEELNTVQKQEIKRQMGDPKGISPEGLSHAVEGYIKALKHQVDVAKSFYFGRLEEGLDGLLTLPEDIRFQVDKLIWDAAGGEAVDPTTPESQYLIASAIMYSVEMRMGISE